MKNTLLLVVVLTLPSVAANCNAALHAGVAKVDITDREAGPVNDPMFARALVITHGEATAVLVSIDAVAIGEIGRIGNDFLPTVRAQLKKELGIAPENVLINASHCHGVVRRDTAALTIEAVKQAWSRRVPVKIGAGTGNEDRISENRRLIMKDGSEVDMRRAYALPADADVKQVGPIDPEIGVLRVDRQDGKPLAVLYNFACHPIMGVPGGGNTADLTGFASSVIEDALGNGTVALFVQGCAGDINPIRYKTVTHPPNAEALGNQLGISVIRARNTIKTRSDHNLKLTSRSIGLPRGLDFQQRIEAIEKEQLSLMRSLRPTDVNFRTFLPLYLNQKLFPLYPSYYAHGYLHERSLGRDGLAKHDEVYRSNVEAYLNNIHVMEKLTRLNTNLALLRKHHDRARAHGNAPINVEVASLRIGDFRLVTFPGELTVEVGLRIKKASPHPLTFVAGYTNGYIYYTPTEKQRNNKGYAQEDCDCMVSPAWQKLFESTAIKLLKGN